MSYLPFLVLNCFSFFCYGISKAQVFLKRRWQLNCCRVELLLESSLLLPVLEEKDECFLSLFAWAFRAATQMRSALLLTVFILKTAPVAAFITSLLGVFCLLFYRVQLFNDASSDGSEFPERCRCSDKIGPDRHRVTINHSANMCVCRILLHCAINSMYVCISRTPHHSVFAEHLNFSSVIEPAPVNKRLSFLCVHPLIWKWQHCWGREPFWHLLIGIRWMNECMSECAASKLVNLKIFRVQEWR